MRNVTIIGIGLIGGSYAMRLRELFPEIKINGIDHNIENLALAISLRIVDKEVTFGDLDQSDLVIVSVPVDSSIDLLAEVLNHSGPNTLVMDVGSTKTKICEAIEHHPKRANFLATHPIAGTEFSGPKAAFKALFYNKTNIICEKKKTDKELLQRILPIFDAMNMQLRFMTAKDHDRHLAFVSHLSHISSFMLGKTVIEEERNAKNIFDLAGSGFASTVRLAKSSPEMWTPIFKQNKENVINTMECYIQNLNHFKEMIENDDYDGIYNDMKDTNIINTILKGIK